MTLLDSYLNFVEEMRKAGDKIWDRSLPKEHESKELFISRLLRMESEPEPGLVAETIYWACIGNDVVGRIGIRHHLTESLSEFGGHIGYDVRPSRRCQGLAKEMLKKVLETKRAIQIGRILLTCSPENMASNKVIRFNGGRLEKTAFVEKWQRETNYYWIDLSP